MRNAAMVRSVNSIGLCIHTGLQQTPQEIWEGLESTLPALRGLLTSCSDVLISGLLKLINTITCLLCFESAWLQWLSAAGAYFA